MFILPVNKDNRVKNTPCLVLALIVANTIVLVATYIGSASSPSKA
jgi:hypothetical protein